MTLTPRMRASAVLSFTTLIIALTATAARTAPQGPAPASGPLVSIEFRAVAADATPLLDLKAAEVTLKVNGREREIRAFDLIQSGHKPGGPARAAIPAPFATNALAMSSRDTLFVIDAESIQPGTEQPLKLVAEQYLSSLAAGDRAGAMTVQSGGLNIGLTNELITVRSALAATVGRGLRMESDEDAACRTRRTLDALIGIFGRYPAGGPSTTVLFFSTGLTPPGVDGPNRVTNPTGVCEIRSRDYQELEAAALASSVNLYVIDAMDTSASSLSASNPLLAGLEHVAGVTGNRLVQPLGKSENGVARMVRENSVSYRVAFAPEPSERNGSSQRVELEVKRNGAEVRVPPRVLIPKAADRTAGKALSAGDMLRVVKVYRDLELRAATFASQEAGSDKVKLVVLFEPVDSSAVVKSAAVGLYDAKGKLMVQGTGDAANLARTPSTIAILAKPGVYRMRVVAVDASGRGGTVDTEVNVGLTRADPLQLGALILGVADAGSFAGRLTFAAEPLAVGYLEVYGVGKDAQLSAQLDVAESETGPSLSQGTTRIVGDSTSDRRVVLGGVSIAQLPPGDILVRMVVSLDGKPVGRVVRTLRKNAK